MALATSWWAQRQYYARTENDDLVLIQHAASIIHYTDSIGLFGDWFLNDVSQR